MHADTRVLKTIAESTIGRRILAEAATEQLATRRGLVTELNRIKADGERRGAAAARAHAEAKAAREQAEAAFKAAQQRETEAVNAWASISNSIERGVDRCRRELEATADPAIDRLIAWLEGAFDVSRRTYPRPDEPAPSMAAIMLGKAAAPAPRRDEPAPCLVIREAIAAAQALKLEALDAEELDQRIAEISATVPSAYAIGGSRG